MALPKILKDFNLFGDGNNWQGQIPTLTLPELTRRMTEYEGGGMDGPIEVDQGGETMTMDWTAGGMIAEIFDTFGSPIHDKAMLRFTGSYESDETGTTMPAEVVVRGRHKSIAMGDVSKGDNNTIEITTTLSYYKLTVDGEQIIEIDRPGGTFVVRGEDRRAERRKNLGL